MLEHDDITHIPVIPVIPDIPDIPIIHDIPIIPVIPVPVIPTPTIPTTCSPVLKSNISFPLIQPEDNNLDVLEINGNSYYKDNTNNNVYQIVNIDDIGVFLGVYDNTTNTILQI